MKKFTVFVAFVCIQTGAGLYAQTTMSPRYSNKPLIEILEDVHQTTDISTYWAKGSWFKYTHPVTFKADSVPFRVVLDYSFRNQPLRYGLASNIIIVIPKNVTGKVTNEEGAPLYRVTVQGAGDNDITNINGEYTLREAACDSTIVFTCVGRVTYTRKVRGDTIINIIMKIKPDSLKEVLINNGYEKKPAERLAGSFSHIGNAFLERQILSDALSKLEAAAPGILVVKNMFKGTNQLSISLRGQSTIYANANPLVVVDDFPYVGNLDNINPYDIEDITILKDASASSIWGVRSGNGVIVITTKKGKANTAPIITFDQSSTITEKPDLTYLPFPTSAQYIEMDSLRYHADFFKDDLNSPYAFVPPDVEIMAAHKNRDITTDEKNARLNRMRETDIWQQVKKWFYQPGITQRYSLNIQGGSSAIQYYLSGSHEINRWTRKEARNKRSTVTTGLQFKLNAFEFGIQGLFTNAEEHNSLPLPAGLFPYSTLVDSSENGAVVPIDLKPGYKQQLAHLFEDWEYRPLEELKEHTLLKKGFHSKIMVSGKYSFAKHFSIKLIYEHQYGNEKWKETNSAQSYYTRNLRNTFAKLQMEKVTYTIPEGAILDQQLSDYVAEKARLQINYDYHKPSHFTISAIAGVEYNTSRTDTSLLRYFGYNNNSLKQPGITNDKLPLVYDTFQKVQIPNRAYANAGFDFFPSAFANASASFRGRYTLSLSARLDQSNLFGTDINNNSIPLASIGYKWNFSEEPFYPFPLFPNFTLQVSYGLSGNINKGVTSFTTSVTGPNNRYNATPMSIINPDNAYLRWEKSGLFNTGIELATQSKLLQLSFEYYLRRSRHLYGPGSQDPTLGIRNYWGNTASLNASGFDFSIETKHKIGKLNIYNQLLFSRTTNKVINIDTSNRNGWYTMAPQYFNPRKGTPVYSIYAYKWAGLDNKGDPQGYINGLTSKNYTDLVSATPDSLVYKGSAVPTLFGSFRSIIKKGSFTFSFTIIGKFRYYFRRSSVYYTYPYNVTTMGYNDYSARWKKAGDEATISIPSFSTSTDENRDRFYNYSEVLIEKGDHIRLHDCSLQYDFTKKIPSSWGLRQLIVTLFTNNLGILWKATGGKIDPDYLAGSPASRSYSLGIKCIF